MLNLPFLFYLSVTAPIFLPFFRYAEIVLVLFDFFLETARCFFSCFTAFLSLLLSIKYCVTLFCCLRKDLPWRLLKTLPFLHRGRSIDFIPGFCRVFFFRRRVLSRELEGWNRLWMKMELDFRRFRTIVFFDAFFEALRLAAFLFENDSLN